MFSNSDYELCAKAIFTLSFPNCKEGIFLSIDMLIIIISHWSTQWAAVITWLSEIRLPPQEDSPFVESNCKRWIIIPWMSPYMHLIATHNRCHPWPLVWIGILSADNAIRYSFIFFPTSWGHYDAIETAFCDTSINEVGQKMYVFLMHQFTKTL